MTVYYDTLTDGVGFHPAPIPVPTRYVTQNLTVHGTLTYKTKRGAGPVETARVRDALSAKMVYKPTLAQTLLFHGALYPGRPITITQGMSIHAALSAAFKVKVVQTLLLHDAPSVKAILKPLLSDGVRLHPLVQFFLGGFLHENLHIATSVAPLWQFPRSVADHLVLADAIVPSLLIRFDLAEGVELSDSTVLRAIYSGQISELLNLAAAYVSPDGNFSTWCINARTSAVTEYSNYGFNSYGRLGNNYFGASSAGLWKLAGPTDNGVPVAWQFGGGIYAPGNVHFTAFKAAYLGMRVDSDVSSFYLQLQTGDGRIYNYQVKPNASMLTTKVTMGKGLRARYYSWTLSGPLGEDFDLDSIEFIPLIAKRRV